MFTVHKKAGVSRLVFDMRRPNMYFNPPPGFSMSSVEAFGYLDWSDDALQGRSVCGMAGDIPDYFYNLEFDSGASSESDDIPGHLWLDGLVGDQLELVRAEAEAAGLGGDWSGADALVLVVLPMGWSYAPLLAQVVLEDVLEQVFSPGDAPMIRHGSTPPEPVPLPGSAAAVDPASRVEGVSGYIDDYGAFVAGPSPAAASMHAADLAARVRSQLESYGLEAHKEQAGTRIETLGVIVDTTQRRIVPHHDKFRAILAATGWLVRVGRCTPKAVERLLGKWTNIILMRRELFACLDEVYAYIQTARERGVSMVSGAVPPGVLGEFRLLLKLAPFATAELWWPVDDEVALVDGAPTGFGVVVARPPHSMVVAEARRAVGSGWYRASGAGDPKRLHDPEVVHQVTPPPAIDPNLLRPAVSWKVAVKGQLRSPESQNTTELRSYTSAVVRYARRRSARQCRVVIGMDSFVCLGVAGKGRSSAPSLLRLCRRAAATILFCELRVCRRYVPSEWNLADLVSRGGRHPGVVHSGSCDRGRESIEAIRPGSLVMAAPQPWKPAGDVTGPAGPLLESAITPSTRKAYSASLRAFDDWCSAKLPDTHQFFKHRLALLTEIGASFEQATALDHAMKEWMTWASLEGQSAQRGGLLIAAVLHERPDLRGKLPLAARAAKAWRRRMPGGEGGPMPEPIVCALVATWPGEHALRTALMFDCLLRIGETSALRKCDISDSGEDMALRLLGTKTGQAVPQGVKVERTWVKILLRDHIRHLGPRDKVFTASQAEFRRELTAALHSLGVPMLPPHSLRHGGASAMFAAGRPCADIKIRGRWASDAAVKRYTKEHALTEYLARCPLVARFLGEQFMARTVRP